jgi:hypothetical protein
MYDEKSAERDRQVRMLSRMLSFVHPRARRIIPIYFFFSNQLYFIFRVLISHSIFQALAREQEELENVKLKETAMQENQAQAQREKRLQVKLAANVFAAKYLQDIQVCTHHRV